MQRGVDLEEVIKYFKCIIPKVVAKTPNFHPSKVDTRVSVVVVVVDVDVEVVVVVVEKC